MASSIENALSLAKLLGGSGSSTTTSTTSKNVSQDAINAMIKKQLESTSGLAAITGGEKTAGLYNSTVAQQLTNDLLSRTAGEAAGQSASTTQTQTTTGASGGVKQAATGLGLLALTDSSFKKSAKAGISSLADVLSGVGASSTPETANAIYEGVSEIPLSGLSEYFNEAPTAVSALADTSLLEDVGTAVSSGWDWFKSIL